MGAVALATGNGRNAEGWLLMLVKRICPNRCVLLMFCPFVGLNVKYSRLLLETSTVPVNGDWGCTDQFVSKFCGKSTATCTFVTGASVENVTGTPPEVPASTTVEPTARLKWL